MPLTIRPGVRLDPEEIARFWAKVDKTETCWLWTGNRGSDNYGRAWAQGLDWMAYRISYELLVGPIPDGYTLDHLCHTQDRTCPGGLACAHRPCVRPEHLEPVTFEENIGRRPQKDQCDLGHPLAEYGGRRRCPICHNARARAARRERSAA